MATFLQAFLFFIALITLHLISKNSYITFVPQISPIKDRELHGNFLHITDFHPDPFYVSNVTARSRCHDHFQADKRPKHMKRGISGPWGAPATVCDTPLGLIDATFEWLEKNWKNKIDFIIWTGDNARHDNDENIPRTPEEIFQLNQMIADKFLKTFGDTNNFRKRNGPPLIPIVPSIGNNDIYPNNIILPGPNDLLKGLHNIWSPFIPKGQHKTFLNGGYFYTEVIPGKLMVVSLNTLYFYNANTAVNGCKAKSQPGTIEMRWLNDVLKRARKHGMKVYLTGHVGPRPKQYMRSCYRKYGRLSLKYHDIILGHFYGHSNMDHFFFINAKDVRRRRRGKLFVNNENDDETFKDDKNIYDDDDDDDDDDYDDDDDEYDDEYEDEDDYEDEDEVKDYDDDDDDCGDGDVKSLKIGNQEELTSEVSQNNTQDEIEIDGGDGDGDEENGKVETNVYNINRYMFRLLKHYRRLSKSEKEYAVIHINPSIIPTFFPALRIFKYNTTEVINEEVDITKKRHPDAPSHINTFLTPLGYTQYFVNLTHANLYPNITPEFTIEYTTWNDYNMKDLTVPSWVQLARKIVSHGFRSSLWKRIQENLMVGTRKLVRQKSKKHYRNSESREKGPEDYIASLSF